VALWLVVLQYAKEANRPVAFVSDDATFYEGEEHPNLHPDLAKEADSAGVAIRFYRDLRGFIVATALSRTEISFDELLGYVAKKELIERIRPQVYQLLSTRGSVEGLEIRDLAFVSGQKYEVGPDSHFIEAVLSGTVLASMLKYSSAARAYGMNTVYGPFVMVPANVVTSQLFQPAQPLTLNTLALTNLYGPTGQFANVYVPAASGLVVNTYAPAVSGQLVSPSVETYRGPLNVQLSLRVRNAAVEAFEIDNETGALSLYEPPSEAPRREKTDPVS